MSEDKCRACRPECRHCGVWRDIVLVPRHHPASADRYECHDANKCAVRVIVNLAKAKIGVL